MALDALSTHATQVAEAAVARSQQARQTLLLCAALTVLAAVLLLMGLAWWLRRAVVQPVLAVEAAARAVAAGDLQHVVQVRSRDEIGRLAQAMQAVQSTLRGVLDAQARWRRRMTPAPSAIAWMPVPSPARSAPWWPTATRWSMRTSR
jgi:methyl-accepting chemotaxis protein-1 (serine sensor receptor)